MNRVSVTEIPDFLFLTGSIWNMITLQPILHYNTLKVMKIRSIIRKYDCKN